jgi:hypothetical protein
MSATCGIDLTSHLAAVFSRSDSDQGAKDPKQMTLVREATF